MKYRDYKIFRPGFYYHVYNRGNNKQKIFQDTSDYLNFIKRCKIALNLLPNPEHRSLNIRPFPKEAFSIGAYCLMPNHFHFLIRQNQEINIDRLMAKICTSYAAYLNKKNGYVGHVFQDAFKAKLVESDSYFLTLSAYIHLNPENPFEYEYSSLPDILGKRNGILCDKNIILNFFQNNSALYKNYIKEKSAKPFDKIEKLTFMDD